MRLTERALREQKTPVSVLAGTFGYGSESAVSNAFKRVTGVAPKRYRMRCSPTRKRLDSSQPGLTRRGR
jgi:AraC-like DNA-binding protein